MSDLTKRQKQLILERGAAAFGERYPSCSSDFSKQKRLMDLQKAICEHDMESIKRIVRTDPLIVNRQLTGSKRFPVLLAMQYKNEEALEFLLKKHPNLLLMSDQGDTVVTALPQVENEKLRKKLLKTYNFQFNHAISVGRKPFGR